MASLVLAPSTNWSTNYTFFGGFPLVKALLGFLNGLNRGFLGGRILLRAPLLRGKTKVNFFPS